MSLTTSAPLSIPSFPSPSQHRRSRNPEATSMSFQSAEDRSAYGTYYERPPSSHSHGHSATMADTNSPERLHSSSGPYHKVVGHHEAHQSPAQHGYPPQDMGPGSVSGPGPSSSHGYPPPQHPITPISGSSTYPPQAPAGGYYGLAGQPQAQIPSPPPTGNGRPTSANFTPDGIPIVPVGISGGKMFQCRGFGECDKVFTRSEHLARHVRKHTGERPFPCHCGKAFSRLDNLRQHSATVHADQAALNESMLASLASVHAALSQRAGREQRKRGEIVEVPKNAVERPRHNEAGLRSQRGASQASHSSYNVYANGEWTVPQNPRPRTGGGWDYQYAPGMEGESGGPSSAPLGPMEDAGPSRRSGSSTEYYSAQYYDQPPGSASRVPQSGPPSATESMAPLPYPYRPMSASGRELPVPSHYADSEPPSTSHGPPPHSPMYPPGVTHANWSSPPTHSAYPPTDSSMYPPPVPATPTYPPDSASSYGPAPPGSSGSYYGYPPAGQGYFPPGQQFGTVPAAQGGQYPPSYGEPTSSSAPESPFAYGQAHPSNPYPYPTPGYDSRKRRGEEQDDQSRKHYRPSSSVPVTVPGQDMPPQHLNAALQPDRHDSNWFPPVSERRSSLAISALLGSPQPNVRSRPTTADVSQLHQQQTYGHTGESNGNDDTPTSANFAYNVVGSDSGLGSVPPTPVVNGTPRRGVREETNGSGSGEMELKAKALLGSGQ